MSRPPPERIPSSVAAVRRELVLAAGAQLAGPFRIARYLLQRRALSAEVRRDLEDWRAPDEPPPARLPDRPLRLFVSCAEASGEAHAVHLVRQLRHLAAEQGAPEPELHGLGGPRLAAAGVTCVGDPVSRAAFGLDVLRSLSFYRELLRGAAEHLGTWRPDACVPVDSPALHVPLARIAQDAGVPVVHYVTPQYWAWAPWRVRAYRQCVDLALTILPFEPAWFGRHGVRTAHVGHPQLDVLADVPSAADEPLGTRQTLVLLPGSRRGVVSRNLTWMIAVAAYVRLVLPDLEVVIPHDRPELEPFLAEHVEAAGARGWIRLAVGDLHGELARARIALSVSGTVLLDLLHHRVPTVVVYGLRSRFSKWVSTRTLTVPWFSSVNLLAGREVLREHVVVGEGPLEEVGGELLRRYVEGPERRTVLEGLEQASRRLGPPGASRRAAGHVLALAAPARERTSPP